MPRFRRQMDDSKHALDCASISLSEKAATDTLQRGRAGLGAEVDNGHCQDHGPWVVCQSTWDVIIG